MNNETCLYAGAFLHFHEKRLNNSKGKPVHWEMVCRSHDHPTQGIDIIPSLRDSFILNLERRFPVASVVIGFPGGICEGTDVVSQGLKELKEETGYTALPNSHIELSPILNSDPWKSSERGQYISVEVDSSIASPQQNLEELEEIQPIIVPKENFLQEIEKIAVQRGCKIDSRMYAYALGRFFGKTNKNE